MINRAVIDAGMVDRLLAALGEHLQARGTPMTLLVVGGSALIALGLVDRTTKDVDVVALVSEQGFASADPLPEPLVAARDKVARDFGLPAIRIAGPKTRRR